MDGFLFLISGLSLLFVLCVSLFLLVCAGPLLPRVPTKRRLTVIPVSGRRPDLEKVVRTWARSERRRGCGVSSGLCLVDCGADDETKRLCTCLSRRWDGVIYLTKSDFENVFLREFFVANRERV